MGSLHTVVYAPRTGAPHEVGVIVVRGGSRRFLPSRTARQVPVGDEDRLERRAGARALLASTDLDAVPDAIRSRFIVGEETGLGVNDELPARFAWAGCG